MHNMMINRDNKPEVVYRDAFMCHFTYIWNLRISFPSKKLYLFDNDVKGTFLHLKYHADVAGAFTFSISSYLIIPMVETFGYVHSPQDWEPFARARAHLVRDPSHCRDLLAKSKSIIDQVESSKPPTEGVSFIPASPDKHHQGIVDISRISYNMFVDNSLFVAVAIVIKHTMTASIEVLYIVLGFLDLTARQDSLSLDKDFQSIYSYERIELRKLVNSRTMTISLTEPKRITVIQELTH